GCAVRAHGGRPAVHRRASQLSAPSVRFWRFVPQRDRRISGQPDLSPPASRRARVGRRSVRFPSLDRAILPGRPLRRFRPFASGHADRRESASPAVHYRSLQREFASMLRAFFAALLAVVMAGPAFGQSQAANGAIEGTVTDASGGVLPGVTVTITNTDTGTERVVVTN